MNREYVNTFIRASLWEIFSEGATVRAHEPRAC